MSEKFYQMQAEVRELLHPAPAPKTIFLVAAWDGKRWSIRRKSSWEEYDTKERAERVAKELASCWSHATIVEVRLPGIPLGAVQPELI